MNKLECFSQLVPKIIDDLKKDETVVLCISGRSCSGKSTLSMEIKSMLNRQGYTVEILCEDSWYKNLEEISRGLYGFYNMEDGLCAYQTACACWGLTPSPTPTRPLRRKTA